MRREVWAFGDISICPLISQVSPSVSHAAVGSRFICCYSCELDPAAVGEDYSRVRCIIFLSYVEAMETQEAQLQPSRPPLDQEVVRLDTENLNKPVEPQDSVGPETDRKDSQDGHSRISGTALSMDDPDVRMAAQALGDLRAGKAAVLLTSPPNIG